MLVIISEYFSNEGTRKSIVTGNSFGKYFVNRYSRGNLIETDKVSHLETAEILAEDWTQHDD